MDNTKMLFDEAEVLEEGVVGNEVSETEEEEEENGDETPDQATPVQE